MFTLDSVALGALTVSVSTQMVIVAVIAFVVGLIVAFLLVTPAKSRSDYIVRGHAQRARMLEQQIGDLQARNDQLQEQNTSVVAERNHLRGQLDALREHNVAIAARGNPNGDGAAPSDQGWQRDRAQDQTRAQEQADQQAAADQQAQAEQEQPQQQESFGERIKGFFSGNNPDNQDTADNTNAPTPNATA